MTIINTTYTTLEDAWGGNFDKSVLTSKKINKKKKTSKADPLCELYSRRLKKANKPYDKKTGEYEKYRAYKGRDNSFYYKYEDDVLPSLANPERQKTSFLTVDDELNATALHTKFDEAFDNSDQCIDVNTLKDVNRKKKRRVHFNVVPEDDDDLYLQDAVYQEESLFDEELAQSTQKRYDKMYSDIYEETDDEQMDDIDISLKTECEDKSLIEEEMKRNAHIQTLQQMIKQHHNFRDERQYLDIILYILSGIILIFMMEQFVQIGMRLKSPY